MPDSHVQQLRTWLSRYLAGELSLADFEELFTGATWDSDDDQAQALTAEVQLRLAEFSNGDWTEEELRERFSPFVPDWSVTSVITTTGSADVSTSPGQFFAADREFQVASE